MRRFLRWLLWVYDGKPDPSRPEPMFVVVGWGPVRLPGEKARIQRIEDETKALLDGLGAPTSSKLPMFDSALDMLAYKRARKREQENAE